MKIAIAGAAGRMGRCLIEAACSQDSGVDLVGATVRPGSNATGRMIAEIISGTACDVRLTDDPVNAAMDADVWIDFTPPDACLTALDGFAGADLGPGAVVIGGTGFSDAQMLGIRVHSERLTIVKSGNFSLGVAVLCKAVRQVAGTLPIAGWDIDILDTHHRHKRDAPSGTAAMLARAARRGRKTAAPARDGPRAEATIAIASIRAGQIIGDHRVMFSGAGETVTLGHRALNRDVFARGALVAARWAFASKTGLYDMTDVLS